MSSAIEGEKEREMRRVSPLLSLRGLSVVRGGKRVVHGVTLEADDGIVLLAGPNGGGKTSILRAIATVDQPSDGSVLLGGSDVSTQRGRRNARRLFGYLPQRPSFPGNFTAAECISYSAWLGGVHARDVNAYAHSALSDFDASHLADRKLSRCSVGESQRVFLAQATAHRPQLLLLDEPTGAIDAEHRAVFRRIVDFMVEESPCCDGYAVGGGAGAPR